MKPLLSLLLLLSPGLCLGDTFILNDGGRLEGEVTGEMDGMVMVKTKYGSLTINRADIKEQQAAPAAAPQPAPQPAAPVEISTPAPAAIEVSTAQVEASTQAPVEVSTAVQPGAVFGEPAAASTHTAEGVVAPAPKLTFNTVQPAGGPRLLVYAENGVVVATETYSFDGSLLASEGAMPDGTYTEYYPEGALKTVRTMMGGKANGTMKSYYPGGALQAEAYYFVGGREGAFKFFTEDGKTLMQAEYKNDQLNGWKKDYGPDGSLAAESYFVDGKPAAPPGARAASEAAAVLAGGEDSQVSVRTISLARGERFEFRLNGKHVGRARLDKEFNLIELEGKLPDGTVKAYSKDGRLQKEFIFEARELKGLRVYEDGGPLKAEYTYLKDKAVKK